MYVHLSAIPKLARASVRHMHLYTYPMYVCTFTFTLEQNWIKHLHLADPFISADLLFDSFTGGPVRCLRHKRTSTSPSIHVRYNQLPICSFNCHQHAEIDTSAFMHVCLCLL
jgi:hypothetical protein